MTDIDREIIRAILIRQFKSEFFHIGLIDDCAKVSNTFIDTSIYTKLSALHCVNYRDMSPTLRTWLFETCINLFSGNGFPLHILGHDHPFPPISTEIKIGDEWVKKFIS